jgi:hypothetical protein
MSETVSMPSTQSPDVLDMLRKKPVPAKNDSVNVVIGVRQNLDGAPTQITDEMRNRILDRAMYRMTGVTGVTGPQRNRLSPDTEPGNQPPNTSMSIITGIKKKGIGKISTKKRYGKKKVEMDVSDDQIDMANGLTPNTPNILNTTSPSTRTTPRPKDLPIREGPASHIQLTENRFPTHDTSAQLKVSQYYLSDRENFINFINKMFDPYKKELAELEKSSQLSCEDMDRKDKDFSLLFHQKVVKEYINLHTPYRGVLLYHGLGSGKTCSSIAITEGLKSTKPVIIMTPASLQKNYVEELKTCGDALYRKNQYWEFVVVDKKVPDETLASQMSRMIGMTQDQILKQGGAWVVNIRKKSNYDTMPGENRAQLDAQIDMMIRNKYQFINYNGLRKNNISNLSDGYTSNPFDDAVVVIDEAHNLVGRIVNKLGKKKDATTSKITSETPTAIALYEYLMSAKNARIVLLSGTPMINYPNELAVLFNILRGKIVTWSIPLSPPSGKRIDEQILRKMIASVSEVDYMEYSATTKVMKITRNPYGFENKSLSGTKYMGVVPSKKRRITRKKNRAGEVVDARVDVAAATDDAFINQLITTLEKSSVKVNKSSISSEAFKSLPDTFDGFKAAFIDPKTHDVKNEMMLQRRIMGLTSYFRSPQEDLMPRYERGKDFHLVKCEMSDFQLAAYEEARVTERMLDMNNAKRRANDAMGGDIFTDTVSTYRIFSRAFCNFVFPRPEIERPMPNKNRESDEVVVGQLTEDMVDAASVEAQIANEDNGLSVDDEDAVRKANDDLVEENYEAQIQKAMDDLEARSGEFLTKEGLAIYSPKFLNVLENITDPTHKGLHLLYSQFRTLEGIGVLRLVLKQNGFAEFKLVRGTNNNWTIDTVPGDEGKPTFALYTGTESVEEKELLRNIYNGDWSKLPDSLRDMVTSRGDSNMYGEIIKLFMITSSGAEGISLKNTRYVHILEPYWHPVRVQQVVGRARRICSHSGLPEEEQTVEVFCYVSTLTKEQLTDDKTTMLRKKDVSKIDASTPVTTDELLFEISSIKERLANELLKNIKESAFDCMIHTKTNKKEGLKCLSFGRPNTSTHATKPNFNANDGDDVSRRNKRRVEVQAVEVRVAGTPYAKDEKSDDLYDYEQYRAGQLVFIGRLVRVGDRYKIER